MAVIAEIFVQEALVLLLCATLLVGSVAVTVFQVRRRSLAEHDAAPGRSDQLFWDVFLGSAVALPALLIPALESAWAGFLLGCAAVATGIAVYKGSPRVMERMSARRQRQEFLPLYSAAEAEHAKLLARWSRYELDPAYGIDYPAMTDVRRSETAAAIRAMNEADQLHRKEHRDYPKAVENFRQALTAAEQAAGIPSEAR